MKKSYLFLTLFLISCVYHEKVSAAGLALRLNSAILEGQANSGSAVTDDPLAIFTNPATTMLHSRPEIALHGLVLLPRTKFKGQTTDPVIPNHLNQVKSRNSAKKALVPAAAFVTPLNNCVALGVVATSPFGLNFDYGKHWGGNRYIIQSGLKTINVTPTIAVKPLDVLSLGGGVQFQNSNAILSSQTSSQNPRAQSILQQSGTRQKAKAHGWGYGWTAGLVFQPIEKFKLGFSYRSTIHTKLKGYISFAHVPISLSNNPALQENRVKTAITYPQSFTLSSSYDLTPEWTALFDIIRTNWSSLKQLVLSTPLDPQAEIIQQKWRDSWFFSGGANYKYCDNWILRFGVAYDQRASRTKFRVPGIPDNSKTIVAMGATYAWNQDLSLSLSYSHEFFQKAPINLKQANIGNAGKGDLKGNIRTQVNFIGLQINYKI